MKSDDASHLCDGVSEALLSLAQDARLGVVVPLPGQLPGGAVAQPHKDARHCIRHVLGRSLRSNQSPHHPKHQLSLTPSCLWGIGNAGDTVSFNANPPLLVLISMRNR